jgi:hypothetical protein
MGFQSASSHQSAIRPALGKAGHRPSCDFLEGMAGVHPPLRLPEGALYHHGPGLTQRLCGKHGHVHRRRAVAEIEGVHGGTPAQTGLRSAEGGCQVADRGAAISSLATGWPAPATTSGSAVPDHRPPSDPSGQTIDAPTVSGSPCTAVTYS